MKPPGHSSPSIRSRFIQEKIQSSAMLIVQKIPIHLHLLLAKRKFKNRCLLLGQIIITTFANCSETAFPAGKFNERAVIAIIITATNSKKKLFNKIPYFRLSFGPRESLFSAKGKWKKLLMETFSLAQILGINVCKLVLGNFSSSSRILLGFILLINLILLI